jgi:NifU-like protein involved in Fe-S cluster formation
MSNMRLFIGTGCGLACAATTMLSLAGAAETKKLQQIPEIRAAVTACLEDRSRLCPDVVPGDGRIAECLAAQQQQLGSSCAAAMARAKAALAALGALPNPESADK